MLYGLKPKEIFVDNLKHLRCNFDLLLEGEHHVDQAKQIYASREETERNLRRELQKAYNKATCEEIHLLRERLNRSEKAKELAHLDVVDRVKENEAVRMIRVKDGIMRFGSSYTQMAHKASIIFSAQQKIGSEIPDVHDRAIQAAKFKGSSGSSHVEEAKKQLRCYSFSPTNREPSIHDPPPPYSPSKEKLNDLSNDLSATSLNDSGKSGLDNYSPIYPSAPVSGQYGVHPPRQMYNGESPGTYPVLSSPTDSESPYSPFRFTATSRPLNWSPTSVEETESESGSPSVPNGRSPPAENVPIKVHRLRSTLRRKRSPETKLENSPCDNELSSSDHCPLSTSEISTNTATRSTPPQNGVSHESPPPYNPFYEWSEFPPEKET
ncbi:hypothetical protein Avbf_00435 [Armadillidium vulgare]|nr:hypothetical protein Avbf_00435 [Armadillidium vulgare]